MIDFAIFSTSIISLIALIIILAWYLMEYKKPYSLNDSQQLYIQLRAIINDWVKEENKLSASLIELSGKEICMLYNLSMLNFKAIGHNQDVIAKLKSILTDTQDLFTYSRFLDMYRYIYTQLPKRYLDKYANDYFNGYKLLDPSNYRYTNKQLRRIRKQYPYLWLLEEIAIVYRSLQS